MKTYRLSLICLLSGALATLPSCAAPPLAKDQCSEAADERAMLACREGEFAAVTSLLGSAVEKLQQRFRDDTPERSRFLAAAQEAWLHYRDAECRVQTYDSRGGAAFRVYELDCLTGLTRDRLDAIQRLLATP